MIAITSNTIKMPTYTPPLKTPAIKSQLLMVVTNIMAMGQIIALNLFIIVLFLKTIGSLKSLLMLDN